MAGVVGKPLNYDELDAAIMRLKGTGRYSNAQLSDSSSKMANRDLR